MMMPYKTLPKRFTIEMVKRTVLIMTSLVRKNNHIHPVQSPRQLVTGLPLRMPKAQVGQYIQAHTGGSSATDVERTSDALYNRTH